MMITLNKSPKYDMRNVILVVFFLGVLAPVVIGFLFDPNTAAWEPSIVVIFQVLSPILAILVGGILLYTNR